MDITKQFEGKKVLIWGYGREGQSTKHFLARHTKAESVDVFEGKREGIAEEAYDIIIKSPGIVMEEDDARFTSQTELFLQAFRDRTIGITGTKGKSTTSALLYHVLSACGKKAILLGNIGEPCLDYYEEIDDETYVVFEMSCHQLAHVDVSPHVAVFLSFFEEHLDYYKTVEKYYAAKARVTKYQTSKDAFYIGEGVELPKTAAKVTRILRQDAGNYELSILGDHNQYNAEFVFRIATSECGCDPEKVKEAMQSFQGLPHRLQYIGEAEGVRYYDDSISTIPSAAIEATRAIPEVGSLILGGMDRGIDYSQLITFIKENPQYLYICTYDSGRKIYYAVLREMGGDYYENLLYCEDLEKAVVLAGERTPKGKACVLSPASASYGYFKNFEQRGEMFREYIEKRHTLVMTK